VIQRQPSGSKPPVVRPYEPHDGRPPRIVVTRHGRWRWSARIVHGALVYQREDGGPYAFTRKRIEAKGRRMLRQYLADRTPEEYEVTP
jgi:riboflavin biosynthesis pyrimidine reductase